LSFPFLNLPREFFIRLAFVCGFPVGSLVSCLSSADMHLRFGLLLRAAGILRTGLVSGRSSYGVYIQVSIPSVANQAHVLASLDLSDANVWFYFYAWSCCISCNGEVHGITFALKQKVLVVSPEVPCGTEAAFPQAFPVSSATWYRVMFLCDSSSEISLLQCNRS
jgi:hypothetical protein